ncbi:MAG: Ig-like domain-containing protein [Lachnospiraceae bacterium]|nr:Ig-like domain-containing protein [Lachnospiraceae bacterium]
MRRNIFAKRILTAALSAVMALSPAMDVFASEALSLEDEGIISEAGQNTDADETDIYDLEWDFEPSALETSPALDRAYAEFMRENEGKEEFSQEDLQEGLELLGDGIASCSDPFEFAGFAVGKLLPAVLGLKSKSETEMETVLKQLDQIIANQNQMIGSLNDINNNVVRSDILSQIRQLNSIDADGTMAKYWASLHDMDTRQGDYSKEKMPNDEDVEKEMKQLLLYSMSGARDDETKPPSDYIEGALDTRAYALGTLLSQPQEVLYQDTNDNMFGIYRMNCRFKNHWEHHTHDELMQVRNAAYNWYLVTASMSALSLQARIQARDEAGLTSPAMKPALAKLKEQVKDVTKAFKDSHVVTYPDNVRVYWYGAKGAAKPLVLYATANKQEVPQEPNTGIGVYQGIFSAKRFKDLKGIDWHEEEDREQGTYYWFSVHLEFWRNFISYNKPGGGTVLCPTAEWYQQVYEDYGRQKTLWDIFFDPSEGGMTAPGGSNKSNWRFMVDPASNNPMNYVEGDTRADRVKTPLLKFDASRDNSSLVGDKKDVDIYMYHYGSNEKDTEFLKNIGGVIGIGIADNVSVGFPPAGGSVSLDGAGSADDVNDKAQKLFNDYYGEYYGDKSYTGTSASQVYKQGSSKGLTFSFSHESEKLIAGLHKDIYLDNVSIEEDDKQETDNYLIQAGKDNTLNLTLKPALLEGLAVGEHTVAVEFDEGLNGYDTKQDPKVSISFSVIRDAKTVYEKDGSAYKPCNPRDMVTGDTFTAVVLNAAGTEEEVSQWKSTNDAVATVTGEGLVTAVSAGEADIIATAGGESVTCKVNVEAAPVVTVTGVTLSKRKISLKEGRNTTLKASVTPKEDTTQKLEWTVNDSTGIALEVSEDTRSVKLTANTAGIYTVTASAKGDPSIKAECTVVVAAESGFTIAGKGNTEGSGVVGVGKKLPMVVNWNGKKPAGAKIAWSVTNIEGAAEINAKGVLIGKKAGRVRVEAVNEANPSKYAMAYVDVYVPVKSIKLNAGSGKVSLVDNATKLKLSVNIKSATGEVPTGINYGEAPTIIYDVDEKYEDYLSIDDNGVITPAAGAKEQKGIPVTVTVLAYNDFEKTLTCKVSIVKANPLKGMKLSKGSLTLNEGDTANVSAVFNPTNPDGSTKVTWAVTSGSEFVSVDPDTGKITALKAGKAVVTATSEATVTKKGKEVPLTATCKITVKTPKKK